MRVERDIVITALVILLLAVAGMMLVWLPQYRERIALTAQLHALEWTLREQANVPHDLPRETRVVADLRAALHLDDRHIPSEADLAGLLREISAALRSQQVVEHETQTGAPQGIDRYHVVPVTLTFNGPFPAVYGLLDHVESMSRLVRVTKVSVAAPPHDHQSPLRVRVELAAFYGHGKERR